MPKGMDCYTWYFRSYCYYLFHRLRFIQIKAVLTYSVCLPSTCFTSVFDYTDIAVQIFNMTSWYAPSILPLFFFAPWFAVVVIVAELRIFSSTLFD